MPIGPNNHLVPPPWLIAMQRYGPPPSYPNLKVPGLNAPIPEVRQVFRCFILLFKCWFHRGRLIWMRETWHGSDVDFSSLLCNSQILGQVVVQANEHQPSI